MLWPYTSTSPGPSSTSSGGGVWMVIATTMLSASAGPPPPRLRPRVTAHPWGHDRSPAAGIRAATAQALNPALLSDEAAQVVERRGVDAFPGKEGTSSGRTGVVAGADGAAGSVVGEGVGGGHELFVILWSVRLYCLLHHVEPHPCHFPALYRKHKLIMELPQFGGHQATR